MTEPHQILIRVEIDPTTAPRRPLGLRIIDAYFRFMWNTFKIVAGIAIGVAIAIVISVAVTVLTH
jgi:hypothetical protein